MRLSTPMGTVARERISAYRAYANAVAPTRRDIPMTEFESELMTRFGVTRDTARKVVRQAHYQTRED